MAKKLMKNGKGRTEMIFYAPDGTSWKDLHILTEGTDEHTTESFILTDGVWKPQRTYVWKRQVK